MIGSKSTGTQPASAGGRVLAVLGPTNTGKTFLAMERLMAHRTGMIGFPLRLLARAIMTMSALSKASTCHPTGWM